MKLTYINVWSEDTLIQWGKHELSWENKVKGEDYKLQMCTKINRKTVTVKKMDNKL